MKMDRDALPGLEGFGGTVFGRDGMFRQVPALRAEAGDFLYWPADPTGRSRPGESVFRRCGLAVCGSGGDVSAYWLSRLRDAKDRAALMCVRTVVVEAVPDGSIRERPRAGSVVLEDLKDMGHGDVGGLVRADAAALLDSLHGEVCRLTGLKWRDLFGGQPLDDLTHGAHVAVANESWRRYMDPTGFYGDSSDAYVNRYSGRADTGLLDRELTKDGMLYLLDSLSSYRQRTRLTGAAVVELERRGVKTLRPTRFGRRELALCVAERILAMTEPGYVKVLNDTRTYMKALGAAAALMKDRVNRLRRMRDRVQGALGRQEEPVAPV